MSEMSVECSVDGRGVATVMLNRPQVNNAYDGDMLAALHATCMALARDAAVRVVVLRGAGAHFQAGADLDWLRGLAARGPADNLAASRVTAEAMRALDELALPTIALVHGACMGGGTGLAASCDIVIAERSARFAISESRWGLTASVIFPQLLQALGLRNLRRYALTGERFDAEQAQRIGLVHEVCVPGGLDAAAAPVIEGLRRSAPGAVALSKRGASRAAAGVVDDHEFARLIAEHSGQRQSGEAREGLASFTEKREAAWVSR